MNATLLHLTFGAMIMTGQISPNDPGVAYSISSNSNPNPAYSVSPTSSDDSKYSLPPTKPKPIKFTITPGTIRQGYDYKKVLKSTIVLSAPAVADFPCHVVSSDPEKLTCSDIMIAKGSIEGDGTVKINWPSVERDARIRVKASSADNSLDDLWYTVSVRRDPSIRLSGPTPTPH